MLIYAEKEEEEEEEEDKEEMEEEEDKEEEEEHLHVLLVDVVPEVGELTEAVGTLAGRGAAGEWKLRNASKNQINII